MVRKNKSMLSWVLVLALIVVTLFGNFKRSNAKTDFSTTDKLADDNYTLEYLLQNGYDVVAFGDLEFTVHCMGGILVNGDTSNSERSNSSGFSDSATVTGPSYIKGYCGGGNANDRGTNNIPVYLAGVAVSYVAGFVATWILGFDDPVE